MTSTTPRHFVDTPPIQSRCIATVVRRLGDMLLEFPPHPPAGGELFCSNPENPVNPVYFFDLIGILRRPSAAKMNKAEGFLSQFFLACLAALAVQLLFFVISASWCLGGSISCAVFLCVLCDLCG
jgi:hypothetical protein